jgi:3-hydroxyisobutyrate dehydrogenase-like beta-hydroxyacid dehydrogenase
MADMRKGKREAGTVAKNAAKHAARHAAKKPAKHTAKAATSRATGSAKKRATATKGTVGVIGLGIMGGSFAANLLKNRWHVIGFDTAPARCRSLARLGGEIAADAADLARRTDTIILSLPSPAALKATAAAIAGAGVKRRVVVEASTFTLDDKQAAAAALREAGHVLLDCPVSGTGAQARTGDIVVYASGGAAAIRTLRPLFSGFSRAAFDLGEFGNGSRMKYVANLLVAIHNVASAEAMVFGIKAGLKPQQIYDLVRAGVGNSRIFELRAPLMVRNRYTPPTVALSVFQKDLDVIGAYARALGVPTPLFEATLPVYAQALADGRGGEDSAAVCTVLEREAGASRPRRDRQPEA